MAPTFRNKIRVVEVVMQHLQSCEIWNREGLRPKRGIYLETDEVEDTTTLYDSIEVMSNDINAIYGLDGLITGIISFQIYDEFIGRVQELADTIYLIMDEAYVQDYNFYKRGKLYLEKQGKLIIGVVHITFKISPDKYDIETGLSLSQ